VANHQNNGPQSRADAGPLGDRLGIEFSDRQSLHPRPAAAPGKKSDGKLLLGYFPPVLGFIAIIRRLAGRSQS